MSLPYDIKELTIKWLTEWKNAAGKHGSKMEFVYRKALTTLRAHNEPILKVDDLIKLKNFGEKTCKRIKDALKTYCVEKGFELSDEDVSPPTQDEEAPSQSQRPSSKPSRTKEATAGRKRDYCPRPNTGGFAILVALYKAETEDDTFSVAKSELMERAQAYSTESMTIAKPGSHFTSWNSMKTLIKNDLVEVEQSRNCFYSLTEAGRELGKKLTAFVNGTSTCCQIEANGQSQNSADDETCENDESESLSSSTANTQASNGAWRVILPPETFDIICLVDSREQTSGVDNSLRKTALLAELQKNGILAEMRGLQVGDFAWIAREKQNSTQGISFGTSKARELVLDVIIERKRVDDLAGSIKDGRWHEQKYRLKNSGIRKPTYLIESFGKGDCSLPFRNLNQAIVNAIVIDGFTVKQTKDYGESIEYLVSMTRYFTKTLQSKTLKGCPKDEMRDGHYLTFAEFDRGSRKLTNFNIGEMFVKQLLQFSGVSIPKAKAITEHYKSFHELKNAYDDCSSDRERELLLSTIRFGETQRNLGPALSKKVFYFYNAK